MLEALNQVSKSVYVASATNDCCGIKLLVLVGHFFVPLSLTCEIDMVITEPAGIV